VPQVASEATTRAYKSAAPHQARAPQSSARASETPFDSLVDGLRAGTMSDDIPRHGTLVRVRRQGGLRVDDATIRAERETAAAKATGGA